MENMFKNVIIGTHGRFDADRNKIQNIRQKVNRVDKESMVGRDKIDSVFKNKEMESEIDTNNLVYCTIC